MDDAHYVPNVRHEITRTALACKAFETKHLMLPATLGQLVPDFLKSVPIDLYCGKPLRYSSQRRMIYSVGLNEKDDGGNPKQQTWRLRDSENKELEPTMLIP